MAATVVYSSMFPYFDKFQGKAVEGKAVVEAAKSFQPLAMPRLDTACAMAQMKGSARRAEPFSSSSGRLNSPFDLPGADHSTSPLQADILDDPVSRPSSPQHEVPGWAGRFTSADKENAGPETKGTKGECRTRTTQIPKENIGPETPRTPRTTRAPRSTTPSPLGPKWKLTRRRMSSPPHKVPGWAERFTSTDVALDGQPLGTVSQLESGQRLTVFTATIGTPSEPTASLTKGNADPETPRTPRTKKAPRSTTPPPLVPKWKLTRPQLLQALQKNSVKDVHSVLEHAPEAAGELFWDHDVEPPLCCAVRLGCEPAIVKLLLENGASPETKDMHGRTPAQILAQGATSLVSPHGFSWPPIASATAHVNTYETWSREVVCLLGIQRLEINIQHDMKL